MKRTSLTIMALLVIGTMTIQAQSTKWAFDNSHSSIQFGVSHMVISEVAGQFNEYSGTVLADEKIFSDAKIDFSIQVKSIDTDDEKRDGHLQSPDFFDVATYPTITFKRGTLKSTGKDTYALTGEMTMHGVTKTITLDAKYGGTVTDPYGNVKAGFKITGSLNRTDYGLKYNSVMETGGLMIGEDVAIVCRVELIKLK